MEPQSSKPCPKGPTLVPVPSQSQFSPGPAILSLQQPISYPPINAQIFQVVYLLQHLTKTLSISLLLPYTVCHTLNSAYFPCVNSILFCIHGLHRDTQSDCTILANYLVQCFPNIFVRNSLLR